MTGRWIARVVTVAALTVALYGGAAVGSGDARYDPPTRYVGGSFQRGTVTTVDVGDVTITVADAP